VTTLTLKAFPSRRIFEEGIPSPMGEGKDEGLISPTLIPRMTKIMDAGPVMD
jgi:hypothetical protein